MTDAANKNAMRAFTFGEPVPVMDKREILDFAEAAFNGKWYEPPVSMTGLAKSFRANPHHSSAIYIKRNILASVFIPHKLLSRSEFSSLALDLMTFGNSYVERIDSMLKLPMALKRSPAKYTRRGKEYFLRNRVADSLSQALFSALRYSGTP